MALRKVEVELSKHMSEDTDIHRAMCSMQSRHTDELRVAEEAGYERGLRDAAFKSARYGYPLLIFVRKISLTIKISRQSYPIPPNLPL